MAYTQREVTAPLPISESGEILPQELDVAFFNQLDESLRRNQTRELDTVLGDMSNRGFLRSGDTMTRVTEDILGPAEDRRAQALLPVAMNAASAGREERLGTLQFERTRQMQKEQFDRELESIRLRAELQKELLQMQEDLEGGNLWGDIAGAAFGSFAGSLSGGLGANLARGITGGVSSLFSSGRNSGQRRTV